MNYLITGPMFAGKSKYLIKSLDYLIMEKSDIKILFIYPAMSFRGYFCRDKTVILDKRIDIITEEDLIDIHIKVFGKCDCVRKGIYSKRIAKDIDRIVIGDDIYKCVCRYCYAGEDEVKLNL